MIYGDILRVFSVTNCN